MMSISRFNFFLLIHLVVGFTTSCGMDSLRFQGSPFDEPGEAPQKEERAPVEKMTIHFSGHISELRQIGKSESAGGTVSHKRIVFAPTEFDYSVTGEMMIL